jgi:hypothetical protein
MALVLKDRVLETASSPGTGTVTLLGATTGYQTFANGVGNSNTTYYTIATVGGAEWEVGIGQYFSANNSVVRQTVISSSNGGSLANFNSGSQSVFVTYPAEQSVYLDASGNVSTLGNIILGTWNANTIGVAYGGTGVTASSGANSVVLRDENVNIQYNNSLPGFTATTSAGTTTTLTAASTYYQRLTGTLDQTYQLPNATTLAAGAAFVFNNDSTGNLSVYDTSSGLVDLIPGGGIDVVTLLANGSSTGTWSKHAYLPASVNWGTTTANFGGTTISNATWNATTIATAYGGTGLTTFTANAAVYATSNSSLTTGTLPVVAGGTGLTTLATGRIPYGDGSNALASSANLTFLNNTIESQYFSATADISANVAYGAFRDGTLGYSDTGIFGSFVHAENGYGQWILQNTSSGNAASADYIVSNDLGTKGTYYGDFGINGSTFAGNGSLSLPNAVYVYSVNGELVLGTTTNNGVRIVTNASNVDAMTINSTNAVAFNGNFGTNTYLLQSTGNATAPIWQSPANISAGSVISTLTFTSAGNGAASGVSFNGSAAQVVSSNTILPTQSGNSGKYLTTDGANNVSWSTVAAASTIANNSVIINSTNATANGTINAGYSGMSVGPVTLANNITITVSSGQRWVIL